MRAYPARMMRRAAFAVLALAAGAGMLPLALPLLARDSDWITPHRAFTAIDYLLVDKSERLMIGYAGGQPVKLWRGLQFGGAPQGHKQFEGDERTPEGRYVIETRNPGSSFHLSLKISYPAPEDRDFAAQYGRSPGGEIFLHGQPNGLPFGRMPGDWTNGCIALSNAEIEELWRIVPDGTVIEIKP